MVFLHFEWQVLLLWMFSWFLNLEIKHLYHKNSAQSHRVQNSVNEDKMKPKGEPEFIVEDSRAQNAPAMHEKRGQWANKKEVILAVVGEIIGLGNVWRFPYLCFKNGGGKKVINVAELHFSSVFLCFCVHCVAELFPAGAFLICYTFFLVSLGIPGFFLEVSLGQLTGQGVVTCWRRICPLMEGTHTSIAALPCFAAVTPDVVLDERYRLRDSGDCHLYGDILHRHPGLGIFLPVRLLPRCSPLGQLQQHLEHR